MDPFLFVFFLSLMFGIKFGIFIIPILFIVLILAWLIYLKKYGNLKGEKNGWKYWFILFTLFLPLWATLNSYRTYTAIQKQIEFLSNHGGDINSVLFTGLIFPFLLISILAVIRIIVPLVLFYFLYKRIKNSACRKLCIVTALGLLMGTFLGITLLLFLGHPSIDVEFKNIDNVSGNAEANKPLESDA